VLDYYDGESKSVSIILVGTNLTVSLIIIKVRYGV